MQLQARVSLRRGVDWTVDGETHHHADPVRVGELQVWDVVNETKMDHPFHLHGFFFQVIEVNGAPPQFLSWEDTINIPAMAVSASPGCPTTARGAGYTTATSSSITPRG